MKEAHSGKIINILSSYVLNLPPEKIAPYITAKYALLGLSKALAVELIKYGITVNMISPGLMATDLSHYLPRKYLEVYSAKHPMGRMTTTDDTADVLEFLISDRANFLNGINIPVNGRGEILMPQTFNIALLSNCTTEYIAMAMKEDFANYKLKAQILNMPYNQYNAEISIPTVVYINLILKLSFSF